MGCALTFDVLAGEEIGPILPPAKGEQCVEPTDIMREIHYEFILHHRDATVHDGIRTTKHSLKNCINCHIQKNKNVANAFNITSEEILNSKTYKP